MSESITDRSDGEAVSNETTDQTTLQAEIEVLREENRRLREEYARARRSEYERTAQVLFAAGLLALVGGFLLPTAQTVLFALGGTGVFIGVLTYYLTPERLLPASVGQDVYGAMARTGAAMVAELGLEDERMYVPADRGGDPEIRLFVPQHTDYEVPEADALADVFVVGDSEQTRGLSVYPTGDALFERFEEARTTDFGPEPDAMAEQLSNALLEQFELLDSASVDAAENRVTVAVSGSAYGAVEEFDHPVTSLLASGLARGLDRPVTVSVDDADDRADALVTCRWDPAEK